MSKVLKFSGVVPAGVILVFVFPPDLSTVYGAAIASAFLMLGLVALRPVVTTRRSRRGALVLAGASRERAQRLCDEFIKRSCRVRIVGRSELAQLAAGTVRMDSVASIVLADGAAVEASEEIAEALLHCKLRGVRVETAAAFLERQTGKVSLEDVSPKWFALADGFCYSRARLALKRAVDLLLAILLLFAAAPVALAAAIAIRLESKGPAIFKQVRVGRGGRNFTLYKFRSMRENAEQDGPVWAQKNDHRVTRVGRFLRATRIDELPQVINVLRGDMSFVGPRPERPYFVDLLKSRVRYYDLRHCTKPGITGWAQVMFPYGASVEDAYQKLQYDLYYAKNLSLRLDLLILLKTVRVVITRQGR